MKLLIAYGRACLENRNQNPKNRIFQQEFVDTEALQEMAKIVEKRGSQVDERFRNIETKVNCFTGTHVGLVCRGK